MDLYLPYAPESNLSHNLVISFLYYAPQAPSLLLIALLTLMKAAAML